MSDFSAWNQFGGWDHVVPLEVNDVVDRWWSILAVEAPWLDMWVDDRLGSMRRVVGELVNEVRDPDDNERLRRLAGAAFEHGAFRAAQGFRRSDVICEFGILLDALDSALRQLGTPAAVAKDALAGLDPEVELAQRTALRSWHRAATHRIGPHDLAVKRLLDEVG